MITKKKIAATVHKLVAEVEKTPIADDSLGSGRSAIALMYFYYSGCFDKPVYAQKGLSLIEEIFGNLSAGNEQAFKSYDLFSGLTGMLAMLGTIKNNNLLEIDDNDLVQFDKMVYEWAMDELDNSNIDFFYGATGVLSYFEEQKKLPGNHQYIDCLVRKIVQLLTANDAVIINKFYNKADERYEMEVNFSLAHGMVSLLNCMLDIYDSGFDKYDLREHVKKSIDYIVDISEKTELTAPYCFVNALNLDSKKVLNQKRIGWCYSDLNILHLLYKGAQVLDNPVWKELADRHAPVVAGRVSLADARVEDAFVCHGSAGLYEYYQSLYNLSGQAVFQKVSGHWLEEAIKFIDNTPKGFYTSKEFTSKAHVHSLFYGLTGVALCLMSAYNSNYSTWRSIIML